MVYPLSTEPASPAGAELLSNKSTRIASAVVDGSEAVITFMSMVAPVEDVDVQRRNIPAVH